ncbi:MAG: NADPH:quinone oxidoreductase family protein [Acidimicrobiia bacterium]|nr:NADPH:quinone oxidoreductase family protein [Acidimicrobiia bacterium]
MRAIVCRELGPPEIHVIDEIPDPEVAPGDVLIDVHYAGVNFPDLLIMAGQYQVRPDLPFTPGAEGAGIVSAVGRDVQSIQVGSRVMFASVVGAFSDTVAVPAAQVTVLPDGIDLATGSVVALAYGTSYHALKQRARLRSGESMLVLGAAGGVGIAAVGLGAAMGATVIAAASTPAKRQFALANGANTAFDYTDGDLRAQLKSVAPKGVDVVYDPVGGGYSEAAFRSLAWDGRHLVVGFTAGDIPALPLNLPLLKGASLVGVFWGAWVARFPDESQRNYREMFDMISRGELTIPAPKVYPAEAFAAALGEIGGRRVLGKVTLQFR